MSQYTTYKKLPYCISCYHIKNISHTTEKRKNVIKPADINRKLKRDALKDKSDYWSFSFEEGVKPWDINKNALPQTGDEELGDLKLRLAHTQWRYDFGFNSPTGFVFGFQNYYSYWFSKFIIVSDNPREEIFVK